MNKFLMATARTPRELLALRQPDLQRTLLDVRARVVAATKEMQDSTEKLQAIEEEIVQYEAALAALSRPSLRIVEKGPKGAA